MSMNDFETCLDRFGFIRTKTTQRDTGNPNIYSEVFTDLFPAAAGVRAMDERRLKLWTGKVLYRTPENSYGQNSHDEMFSFLKMLHRIGNKKLARQVLWRLIICCGFMYNKPFSECSWKEKGDGWIGRFPQIWAMAFVAAFPISLVNYFSRLVLSVSARLSTPDLNDASGLQLQWQICSAITQLGCACPMQTLLDKLEASGTSMAEVMSTPRTPTDEPYYDPTHLTIHGFEIYPLTMLRADV